MIYAYSMVAINSRVINQYTHSTTAQSGAGCCIAVSEEEALGIALKSAYERYPEEEGYTNQSASVVKVPNDWIIKAAEMLREEEVE